MYKGNAGMQDKLKTKCVHFPNIKRKGKQGMWMSCPGETKTTKVIVKRRDLFQLQKINKYGDAPFADPSWSLLPSRGVRPFLYSSWEGLKCRWCGTMSTFGQILVQITG